MERNSSDFVQIKTKNQIMSCRKIGGIYVLSCISERLINIFMNLTWSMFLFKAKEPSGNLNSIQHLRDRILQKDFFIAIFAGHLFFVQP